MNKAEMIEYITSFREPPFIKDDLYWQRYPWDGKFGGFDGSSICCGWRWFKNSYIDENTTDEDVEKAYNEIKTYYEG